MYQDMRSVPTLTRIAMLSLSIPTAFWIISFSSSLPVALTPASPRHVYRRQLGEGAQFREPTFVLRDRRRVRTPSGPLGLYADIAYGRLGNKMFQYAALYAMATAAGRTAFFTADYVEHPRWTFPNVPMTYVPRTTYRKHYARMRTITENAPGMYDPTLVGRLPRQDVQICCYFQSYKYFRDLKRTIRTMFQFADDIRQMAARFLDDVAEAARAASPAFDTSITYVGVHVRRGDLTSIQNQAFGIRLPDASYFIRAARRFTTDYRQVVFVAASDEPQWSLDHLWKGIPNLYLSVNHTQEQDLAILAACNHTIMSVGTFGWWAAFLAGGDVIYYKHMFAANSTVQNISKVEDFVLPHWIGMG